MALLTVEGVYRDGRVELAETPAGIEEAPVMVVFLPRDTARAVDADVRAARHAAGERLLARMRKGFHLGGERPYQDRAELYVM
jgi:hypothetical protein